MSSKSSTATHGHHDSHSTRKLQHRALPFLGPLLMVPVALLAGIMAHEALKASAAQLALGSAGIVAGTAILALVAHEVGAKRRPIVRWQVTVTIAVAGLAEAVTVAIGAPKAWATTFLLAGLFVAGSWALHRLDALRHNPSEAAAAEDPLTKKLGLEHTRFGRPKHHTDEHGDVTRIEVPVKHGPGETVEVIQSAVPNIESVAKAPRGRSRAVQDPEDASKSTLTIITKDVLKGDIPYPGPSSPGGCITEPLVDALYEDQQPGVKFIAGGHKDAPNPSSVGRMGMTRTGKTMDAQIDAMEMFTRRNVAPLFWFDTVKGAQTVRPLRRGMGIIVASDNPAQFRRGMKALGNLIRWRAARLGECGYRAWTPACATDPRLMMPLLFAHFEEADELCEQASEEVIFLASKGLSTGVVTSWSLQRADATSMPTGLRFNIGTWGVWGCGDDYSASFALSSATIDAGAHPENWKQSKPGYHYLEGIGVDETRWPVVRKGFIASDPQMEAHAGVWGPRMMPLDRGSVTALGQWYVDARAETVAWCDRWDNPETSANTTPTPAPTVPDTDSDDEPFEDVVQEAREEINEMCRTGGLLPQLDAEASRIDPTKPVPVPPPDDLHWGDDKDAAPTREAALDAFERALNEIADDPELRDPADPSVVLFEVKTLVERYKFRSRPWFSEHLTALADGEIGFPGLTLARTDTAGRYRLEKVAEVFAFGHSA